MTINGTGFGGATSVTFNGVEATAISSVTATSLKATVPPGAVTGPITVTNASGAGSGGTNFAVPLAITSFSPSSGLEGTAVTINGVGFNKAIGVKFGDLTADGTIDSDTQITAIVPPGAVTAPITVGTDRSRSRGPQSLYGSCTSRPAIATPSGRSVCFTRIEPA